VKHPNKEGGEGESGSRAEGILIRKESPKGDEEGKGDRRRKRGTEGPKASKKGWRHTASK
jgi:hypothetical protein